MSGPDQKTDATYKVHNFITGTVREYRRVGECAKCGACCKITVWMNGSPFPREPLGPHTKPDGAGVWYETPGGGFYQIIGLNANVDPCKDLLPDDRCKRDALYSTFCKDWPFSPEHLCFFPSCGYDFIGEYLTVMDNT